jgi:DNA modification methylase
MLYEGDVLTELHNVDDASCQLIVADPPYFQVLDQEWDQQWQSPDDYLTWAQAWIRLAGTKLKDDGIFYIFGQLGKREHTWLHLCSLATKIWQFHDMIIWDRAVGYNERYDSFTPQYEMALALRKSANWSAFFDKDAVRIPYPEATVSQYMRDNRYKDLEARRAHLEKGKYATNILRVPSLKGNSKEKVGHPSQKPIRLIEMLVASSSRPGDLVLDLFAGSGTTSVVCARSKRQWIAIEMNPAYAEIIRQRMADDDRQPDLNLGA